MSAEILKPTEEALKKAASLIRKGGLVAFPTETVYGLGTNALDANAVAKIFEVKQRPRFDPIIVHIANLKDIERLCREVNERARMLIKKFLPGPLTLVLPKSDIVPDIVTAGLETVAIRMPAHPVALKLIKMAKVPIAAPSANLFGCLSPTTAKHVAEQIGENIDLIIDGGKCPIGIESTVLEIVEKPLILRPGGLPIEEIEKVIGKIEISSLSKRPRSPGQLERHYSPRTPLKILKKDSVVPPGIKAGLLAFKPPEDKLSFEKIEVLSVSGDLREAACNFFSCLHRLDKADLDIIYAEPVPETGLGKAIMDRLRKAEGIKMGRFATAINCMDGRVQMPVTEYIKNKYEVDYVDMITLPGPNKVLAESKDKSTLESIKRCIEISLNLHSSKLIAICGHFDCAGNPANQESQIKQILDAIKVTKLWFPDVRVTGLWVNQSWKVEEVKCM